VLALARALAILILASACGPAGGTALTATAPLTSPPAPAATATSTPAPTQPPGIEVVLPTGESSFPLDLVPIRAENLAQLAPFRALGSADLPGSLASASLAFTASFEYGLVAHLDDGQLFQWNMATGELTYQDWLGSADSFSSPHPPLAISPSYQGYLATSEAIAAEAGPRTADGTVLRTPDDPQSSILLSAVSIHPDRADTGVRLSGLAFSPDGQLLAVGLGDAQGGYVQVWDVFATEAASPIQEIEFAQAPAALQFTPDGSALVCADGSELVHLDPRSGAELQRDSVGFPIGGFSFDPSGSLAVWGGGAAVLRAPALAEPLDVLAFDQIRRVEFSPDSRLAVVADGDRLRVLDLSAGVELTGFHGPSQFLDVRFFDNGRLLATIDEQARVLLWGVRGGFQLPDASARILPSNAASLQRAASLYIPGAFDDRLSPHSDWLAAGSGEGVYLVDLPSLQLRRLLEQDDLGYTVFDTSADGRRLAWLADQGVVRIWDIQQDSLVGQIVAPDEGCCGQVLLAPDGGSLVTMTGQTATLWDLATGGEVYSRADVQAVHFSPDGTRLAFESGIALRVSIWDRRTGRDVRQLTGFETAAPVYGVKFSPDWRTMYWAARASMQFSDVESGALGAFVPYSWGEFSPRGDRIAVVEDGWIYQTVGQVIVLDLDSGETVAVLDHHADAIVRSVAYSPDGRLLATGLGDTIKIWDALSGVELATLPPSEGSVGSLAFSADGRMLLSTTDGSLAEFWVVPGGAAAEAETINPTTADLVVPVDTLELQETATGAAFSPDGSTVAVSTASGVIWTWDLAAGGTAEARKSHGGWIYQLGFAPSGLASVSKAGTVRFDGPIDAYGASPDPPGEVSALAILPDGSALATSGEDGVLRLWELPSLLPGQSIQAHSAWVWGLAVSPTGELLATASADRKIKLWRIDRDSAGEQRLSAVATLSGHTETVWAVDFSPSDSTLASASWDRTVRLWEVPSGRPLAALQGHTDWVYDVAYSPDGRVLASSSADGTVRLWDPATGDLLATLEGSGGRIWSVGFSPDGRYLVSASDSGEVVLWGIAP
jgi:WD40 repeat protein